MDFINSFKIGTLQAKESQQEIEECAETFVKNFTEKFYEYSANDLINILEIKNIINNPDVSTSEAYEFIQKNFAEKDFFNILRLERWPDKVNCIYCHSQDIQLLRRETLKNYYLCLGCEATFNDGSDTPITNDKISLWMLLWLFANRPDLLVFLNNELGISIAELEETQEKARTFFANNEGPLIRFLSFDGWESLTAVEFREQLTADLLRDAVMSSGNRKRPRYHN